jgi:hypothetical protein
LRDPDICAEQGIRLAQELRKSVPEALDIGLSPVAAAVALLDLGGELHQPGEVLARIGRPARPATAVSGENPAPGSTWKTDRRSWILVTAVGQHAVARAVEFNVYEIDHREMSDMPVPGDSIFIRSKE